MTTSQKIQEALSRVKDQSTFITELLQGALGWPVPEKTESLDDIGYGWSESDLRSRGLSEKIVDGTIRQILLQNNQPWGIFVLEFKHPDVFTTGRGLTGPLRSVLRGLVASRRRDAKLASFRQENLLFICTHQYQHYRFACFKAATGDIKAAPLSTFGWGPDSPARTASEFNLPELVWPKANIAATAWGNAWAAAFDVEKVTKRFYEEYKKAFENAEKLIATAASLTEEELRLFTQTLFNRLMFLRFLERKGWLEFDGCHDYLRALHHAGPFGGQSFYASRLVPLFFSALAVEGAQGNKAVGNVPFLNGGLFAKSTLDAKINDLPGAVFDPIIGPDGLFYRFNFTVEESTPLDIEAAVDPEMLGKVFEELVTGRHESGSYYTPRPIVSFMCRAALKAHLGDKTKASPEALELLVDKHEVSGLTDAHARQIIDALDSLKAVDPACGSGAYLLGLMQELIAIYRLLYSEKLVRDARSLYDLKLRIISHNLYGVDIDPFATNIAMLRLWLSLSVEADQPLPLPNLEFKIETGDSLLGPDPTGPKDNVETGDLFIARMISIADDLVQFKDRYLTAHGGEKQQLREVIEREESRIAQELRAIRGKDIIDWRIQFAEVFFKNKGFDIALANPPYVRQELISKIKPDLRRIFPKVFDGAADLYVYFYARALQILRTGGTLAFISSNKFFRAGYGGGLRQYLAEETELRVAIDFGDLPIFEATAYPCIIATSKRLPEVTHEAQTLQVKNMEEFGRFTELVKAAASPIPQKDFNSVGWQLESPAVLRLLAKLRGSGKPLGEYVNKRLYRGIITGLNEAFIVGRATREQLIGKHESSNGILKPILRGRDVKRWRTEFAEQYLIRIESSENRKQPWSGRSAKEAERIFSETFPAIHEHFQLLRDVKLEQPDARGCRTKFEQLRSRDDQGKYFWELRSCKYWEDFDETIIAWGNLATRPQFSLVGGCYHISAPATFLVSDSKYLLGILNSQITKFLVSQSAAARQGGFWEYKPMYISPLAVPAAPRGEHGLVEKVVEQIVLAKRNNPEADTGALEHEIDQLVYRLYNLTSEEIAIVEGAG